MLLFNILFANVEYGVFPPVKVATFPVEFPIEWFPPIPYYPTPTPQSDKWEPPISPDKWLLWLSQLVDLVVVLVLMLVTSGAKADCHLKAVTIPLDSGKLVLHFHALFLTRRGDKSLKKQFALTIFFLFLPHSIWMIQNMMRG